MGAGSRRSARNALAAFGLTLAAWHGGAPAVGQAPSQVFGGGLGLEITTPVEQAFGQLSVLARHWLEAARAGRWDDAERLQEDLLVSVRQLSFGRLPDLSVAAGALAVEAAGRGEHAAVAQLLAAAEAFDAGRPETSLAAAQAARRSGRVLEVLRREAQAWSRGAGVGRLARLTRLDLAAAPLLALLFAGGLFVALHAAHKAPRVLRDLRRFLELILPGPLALAVAVALVVWPLVLPSGLLWLAAYWAIFLWSDASLSERIVLTFFLLLVWLSPPLVTEIERRRPVDNSAALRSLDLLAEGRLPGTFLADVGALQASLPDEPAARQVIADVHRRIGQWEHARALYAELAANEPGNVAAVLGLGAYYSAKGDFRRAVEWYRQASEVEPPSAAAFFNLSQAFNASYLFDDSRRALDEARRIDAALVGSWIGAAEAPRWIVPEAAISRRGEIHARLLAQRSAPASPLGLPAWVISLAAWAVAMALALAAHLARQRGKSPGPANAAATAGGAPARPLPTAQAAAWARWLLPGLNGVEQGAGGRTFLALLFVAVLLLAALDGAWRHRLPMPFLADGVLLPLVASALLVLWMLGRWLWLRAAEF